MAGRRDSMKATETNVEQIPALLKLLKYIYAPALDGTKPVDHCILVQIPRQD